MSKFPFIRTESGWQIINLLVARKAFDLVHAMSGSEICERSGYSKQNCHRQCLRLLDHGLLIRQKEGRFNYWYLADCHELSKYGFNPGRTYNPKYSGGHY